MAPTVLDRLIGYFDPKAGLSRMMARAALERSYEAVDRKRASNARRMRGRGPNAAQRAYLQPVRDMARDLVRNGPDAAAALRALTAYAIGDGVTVACEHKNPRVARLAQEIWDAESLKPLDGRNDVYAQQKIAFRAMILDGEVLKVWSAVGSEPNARCVVREADFLDEQLSTAFGQTGNTIVAGVEFDALGDRIAYHLFDHHPRDLVSRGARRRVAAEHVDHIFEEERPGQARGISRFAPILTTLLDLDDIELAIRERRKAEASIGLIVKQGPMSGAFNPAAPQLGAGDPAQASGPGAEVLDMAGAPIERITPGMIARMVQGDEITTLNWSSAGDATEFQRMQRYLVSAAFGVPYFMLSGDTSQSNYTSQRADLVKFYVLLDQLQRLVIEPQDLQPTFRRIMQRAALRTGNRKLLEVVARPIWPPKPVVDPLKDGLAEIHEIRAGLKSMPDALRARGHDPVAHVEAIGDWITMTDKAGLVLDTDPRRTAGSGNLQPAAGYVRPTGDATDQTDTGA